MQQTFPAGQEPRIIIAQVSGDLTVQGWDQPGITVEAGGRVADLHQEGDALMIIGSSDDLELKVPTGAEIKVTNLKGDVSIQNVRRVELEGISSDVKLQNIGIGADREKIGEAVALAELRGDLNVTNASSLRARRDIRGDASLTNVALIEIETIGGDLSLQQAETVVIGTVGGDLEAMDIDDALSCGNVGGDCQVNGSSSSEVAVGNAGGDIEVYGAASVHLGSVGGDCELRDVTGNVVAGNVGGDAGFYAVGGNLQVGSIGADAELMDLKGTIEVGSIGGDLELQATFPAGSYTRLNVGGDASVLLPNNANLSIRAAAGGEVVGEAVNFGGRGNLISLVYGDGSAHLELSVGGDLEIHGAGSPHSSTTTNSWGDFGLAVKWPNWAARWGDWVKSWAARSLLLSRGLVGRKARDGPMNSRVRWMSKHAVPNGALTRAYVVPKNRNGVLKKERARQANGHQTVCVYVSMTASGGWTPSALSVLRSRPAKPPPRALQAHLKQ